MGTDVKGNDAYLCVEYNWDGDEYQEDFGPEKVRKPGDSITVYQILNPDAPQPRPLGVSQNADSSYRAWALAPPPSVSPGVASSVDTARDPDAWTWPEWCLKLKAPCVEVFVQDEGESRWCLGKPQSRVTDGNGNDAYLCVEYTWDGENYQEDFPPKNIRRPGGSKNVWQLILEQEFS